MQARTLLEQYCGAGPPSHQTADPSEPGIPILSLGVANASGNRDDEHDSQGTSQMVSKERHRRAGRVHRTTVWASPRFDRWDQLPLFTLSLLQMQHCRPGRRLSAGLCLTVAPTPDTCGVLVPRRPSEFQRGSCLPDLRFVLSVRYKRPIARWRVIAGSSAPLIGVLHAQSLVASLLQAQPSGVVHIPMH